MSSRAAWLGRHRMLIAGLLIAAGFGALVLAVTFDAGVVILPWNLIEAVVHAVL